MSLCKIKNSVGFAILTLFLFLGIFNTTFASESIENYEVDIYVTDQGQLEITEQITYNFSDQQRHGIFRTIPLDQVPDDASTFYQERYIDISLASVQRNGESEPYKLESSRNKFSVRIGDPDVTHTGIHTYTIRYQVDGALVSFTDGPVGIYWNAIGDQWEIPIKKATISITAQENILLDTVSECYLGKTGSKQECGRVSAENTDRAFVYQIDTIINPAQAVTVMQAVDDTQVKITKLERIKFWFLMLGVIVIGGLGTLFIIYRFRTKHKTNEPELVQYEPYQDTKPMYAGVLIDGKLHSRDITAGIVYLAQQGYIKIKKLETNVFWFFPTTDYEILRQKDVDYKKNPFLFSVFSLLFMDNEKKTKISELKKNTIRKNINHSNIRSLKYSIQDELKQEGFYEHPFKNQLRIVGVLLVTIIMALYVLSANGWIVLAEEYMLLTIPVAILLIGLIFGLYKRLTKKGYQAQNRLRGFRKYLAMTEKERYAFHNDPAKNPEKFMEYLPYAIAFGVEDKWAEVFKDVSIPQPEWYEGDSITNFNTVAFASSLNNFSSAFVKSSGSVSSSGGSAGGGAGGGGGGSW